MQNASYLESKILTASPHRLHLMLIEGAIRFGRQAKEALHTGDAVAAASPLLRTLDIVGEMLVGVRENKTELTRKIADVYLFIFRRVSQAKINSDAAALAEAIQLLEYERDTWQQLCLQLGSDAVAAKITPPHLRSFNSGATTTPNAGISWQA